MSETKYTEPPDDMLSLLKGEHMCAADLDGKTWVVTISDVRVAHLEANAVVSKAAVKGAIKFSDGPVDAASGRNKMLLNATNTRAIVKLYGKKPKPWIGKQIAIYPTTTTMAGKVVDCIRVRPELPAAPQGAK